MPERAEKRKPASFSRKWIRKYVESLHDPKVVSLSDSQYRDWDRLLLIAAKSEDGVLPSLRSVACELRCTESHAFAAISDLVDAGLIDVVSYVPTPTYKPHGWDRRQYAWDAGDLTAKDRMKRHRQRKKTTTQRKRNGRVTVGVTEIPSESVSESSLPRTTVAIIQEGDGSYLGCDGDDVAGGAA